MSAERGPYESRNLYGTSVADHAYWDEKGHKSDCYTLGDDWMTEPCTCGPAPDSGSSEHNPPSSARVVAGRGSSTRTQSVTE